MRFKNIMNLKLSIIRRLLKQGKTIQNLRNSNLRNSDLSDSYLRNSYLRNSDLRNSDLSGSYLRNSDLSGSNLRGSDLRYSNLSDSNLRGSDLRNSDLSYSDLRNSDLRDSDLSGSKGLKFIQISGIGSANRQTTYLFNYDIVFCGCFKGTLVEFEEEVRKTHVKNIQYLNEYLVLLKYIKKLKEIKQ